MKIYFASDAHLGARFHKDPLAIEKKLVRWLDSIKEDASAIWFLGDLFDYWYEYKYVVPKGHVRFLGKLAELADRGIEIHIFIGNHDIWMFDYLPKEIGAIIHRDTLTVDLLGKRFFLGHGDEVDFRSKAFRLIRAIFRNKFCDGDPADAKDDTPKDDVLPFVNEEAATGVPPVAGPEGEDSSEKKDN